MRSNGCWNCFSKFWFWSAVPILFAAAAIAVPQVAISQNTAAGPQSGAAPSDQPNQTANASRESTPNLAGTWKLNQDESDNPQEKIQEAGGSGGRGAGMGRRRRGGGNNMMSALSQLKIEQSGSSIKITNANGREIAQYPGAGSSSNAAPVAEWHGAQLVSTRQGRSGGTTSRTFELSPDGKQLYMTTKIDNPRLQQPVSIRFVYDPAKSSE
jgi:hypothetical protein